MEMETDFIIDLHIADQRQTDLKSTNMEREALKIILNRLENVLDIVEVVTDASSSIIKLLGKCVIFLVLLIKIIALWQSQSNKFVIIIHC